MMKYQKVTVRDKKVEEDEMESQEGKQKTEMRD